MGLLLSLPSGAAQAQSARLTAEPVRCVSLHRGQMCHFTANLHWQSAKTGPHCLFRVAQEAPLACWPLASSGSVSLPMRSDAAVDFELRAGHTAVATARIDIAWVYDARRRAKSSWRLF